MIPASITQWADLLRSCGVEPDTASTWAPFFFAEIKAGTFSAGDDDLCNFLGQVLHESGYLEVLEENLNYSPERLRAVWPLRFPSPVAAMPFAHHAEALANKVYGGRLGNTEPGDGWAFRGSGPIQVTGRANFTELQALTGIPLIEHPELLRRPGAEAVRLCVAWWEKHIPDGILGSAARVTKMVNGGYVGFEERQAITKKARAALA